jgi:hypothetical protein
MRTAALVHLAALLAPDRARQALALAARDADGETLEQFTARAGDAFERDMAPVCQAIVSALHGGNLQDFRDLRILLPHLLQSVMRHTELSDLLAYQLGRTFLDGLMEGRNPQGEEEA